MKEETENSDPDSNCSLSACKLLDQNCKLLILLQVILLTLLSDVSDADDGLTQFLAICDWFDYFSLFLLKKKWENEKKERKRNGEDFL